MNNYLVLFVVCFEKTKKTHVHSYAGYGLVDTFTQYVGCEIITADQVCIKSIIVLNDPLKFLLFFTFYERS
jgi:hypothetical protein